MKYIYWHNRKRKVNTELKYQQLRTGGGESEKKEEDPLMDLIDAAAPGVDVEMDCEWDSTAHFKCKFRS